MNKEVKIIESDNGKTCQFFCESVEAEEHCIATITRIIDFVDSDLKSIFAEDSYSWLKFEFSVQQHVYDEKSFFEHAVRHKKTHSLIAELLNKILFFQLSEQVYIWSDDENCLGQWPAFLLAIEDEQYISNFADFLLGMDLDHEVHQGELINKLIDKWHYTDAVLYMLSLRVTLAVGQHGYEQIDETTLFPFFTKHPDKLEHFLQTGLILLTKKAREDQQSCSLEGLMLCIPDKQYAHHWFDKNFILLSNAGFDVYGSDLFGAELHYELVYEAEESDYLSLLDGMIESVPQRLSDISSQYQEFDCYVDFCIEHNNDYLNQAEFVQLFEDSAQCESKLAELAECLLNYQMQHQVYIWTLDQSDKNRYSPALYPKYRTVVGFQLAGALSVKNSRYLPLFTRYHQYLLMQSEYNARLYLDDLIDNNKYTDELVDYLSVIGASHLRFEQLDKEVHFYYDDFKDYLNDNPDVLEKFLTSGLELVLRRANKNEYFDLSDILFFVSCITDEAQAKQWYEKTVSSMETQYEKIIPAKFGHVINFSSSEYSSGSGFLVESFFNEFPQQLESMSSISVNKTFIINLDVDGRDEEQIARLCVNDEKYHQPFKILLEKIKKLQSRNEFLYYKPGIHNHLMLDEHPQRYQSHVGVYLSACLALADIQYVRNHADYLLSLDVDDELANDFIVADIINGHGVNEQTLYLIAVCITTSSGQTGLDVLSDENLPILREEFKRSPKLLKQCLAIGLDLLRKAEKLDRSFVENLASLIPEQGLVSDWVESNLSNNQSQALELFQQCNHQEAFGLLKPLAEQGDAMAQYYLAILYFNGHDIDHDYEKSQYWFEQAAVQDMTEAMCKLGMLYVYMDDKKQQGFELLETVLERNYVYAFSIMAERYYYGNGVSLDKDKALSLFHKGAELGDGICQDWMGILYERGDLVPQDMNKAIQYYEQGAANDNQHAIITLGKWYFKGENLAKDDGKAIELFLRAAHFDNGEGHLWTGYMHEYGYGVAQSNVIAIAHYTMARSFSNAPELLENLKLEISDEDITLANEYCQEMYKKIDDIRKHQLVKDCHIN